MSTVARPRRSTLEQGRAVNGNVSALGQVYADAILEVARARGQTLGFRDDLEFLGALYHREQAFRDLLDSPLIDPEQKKASLARLFRAFIHTDVFHFLCLLVDRRRQFLLDEIAWAYGEAVDRERGILPVGVRSAAPLSPVNAGRLSSLIAKRTGLEVQLELAVDAALLGGIAVSVGDRLVDGTLKTRLAHLGRRLHGQRFKGDTYYEN